MKAQTQSRLKLLLVFALFFIPIFVSYGLYYGMDGVVAGGQTNHGELLSPVRPLPQFPLEGPEGKTSSEKVLGDQWTLLQVTQGDCLDACQQGLRETRQVWALLNDDRPRVQRVLLVDGTRPQFPKQPFLEVYSGDLNRLQRTIDKHRADAPGTIYLIDPHGNWVLYYPPDGNGTGLFKDLQHLLRLSSIG